MNRGLGRLLAAALALILFIGSAAGILERLDDRWRASAYGVMMRIAFGRAAWVVLALVIAAAAGGLGYVAGRNQQHRAHIAFLQINAAGNLNQRVEVLSLLRMGDVSGAITQLESEADSLTVSIAANRGADRQALAYVKTYLSVAPPSPARAQRLSPALEGVPTLTPRQCRTALRALLVAAQERRGK